MKIKTKYVWYDGEKWKVEKLFSPTKFDNFLLLSMEDSTHIHEDDKTIPVRMQLIDVENETFYWDTLETRKIMKQFNSLEEEHRKQIDKLQTALVDGWVDKD
jgi:hypothetical protein